MTGSVHPAGPHHRPASLGHSSGNTCTREVTHETETAGITAALTDCVLCARQCWELHVDDVYHSPGAAGKCYLDQEQPENTEHLGKPFPLEMKTTRCCGSEKAGVQGTMPAHHRRERKMFLREVTAVHMIYKVDSLVSGQCSLVSWAAWHCSMNKVKWYF